jgi:DNA-binding transcriptional regulator YiaG
MTAKEIITLRKALGLSQQELAERLGTYRETVARWESGATKPHRLYLVELNKLKARMKK